MPHLSGHDCKRSLGTLSSVPFLTTLTGLRPFVCRPCRLRGSNRHALPLLGAAAKENHDAFAVFAKIDPVSGPEVDLILIDAGADTYNVRKVAAAQARQRYGNRCRCDRVQTSEPYAKRRSTRGVQVLQSLDVSHRLNGNTKVTMLHKGENPCKAEAKRPSIFGRLIAP